MKAHSLILILFLSSGLRSAGQCGNTPGVRSYDTLLTGPGYGTYTISFPKWNPDSGALLSVKLSALVNQQYSFTLKNADLSPSIYTLLVGRYDEISSPVMSLPFSTTTEQTIGAYSLNPGASVSRTPFTLLQNYASTDSITDQVATFAGSGSLSFVYAPITYSDVHTNNNSSYSYGAAAADSIHFSITYQYCKTTVLSSSLISFTAQPQAPSFVQLSWIMANEVAGRGYEVQQSVDGIHFTSVGSLVSAGGPGNADYHYDWNGSPGKWYFRLKIETPGVTVFYSDIKIVTLGSDAGNGMRLYPDPATDFVNIDLPFTDMAGGNTRGNATAAGGSGVNTGDWQIDLFSADGRLLQHERYSHIHTARLDFRQALVRGTYFIRAANMVTGRIYSSSFLSR